MFVWLSFGENNEKGFVYFGALNMGPPSIALWL